MKNRSGFTLVELLIVIGIIGVLATISIPTFKKMVQKSKKAEAKTALAGLYTAEAGFIAEYGTYGSRLSKVGFEMNGNTQTYTMGFPSALCGSVAIAPDATSQQGIYLNSVYGAYYNTAAEAYSGIVEASAARKPTQCELGSIGATTFLATATGAIAASADPANKATMDVWTMNEQRVLTNIVDGVR